jgi:hypothetical protein
MCRLAGGAFNFADRGTAGMPVQSKKTNRSGLPPKKTAQQLLTACKLTSDCRTTSKFYKSISYKNNNFEIEF